MEYQNLLCELARLLKPEVYVELGVRDGDTFNSLSPLVKRAIAVDIKPMPKVVRRPHVQLLQMYTSEAAIKLAGQKDFSFIDFLFIDACHEKFSVLSDFRSFAPFVREGTGLIFLHDTHPVNKKLLSSKRCHNAWEAAWEIRQMYHDTFEIVTLPGPRAGLSVLRRSRTQLSWENQNA